MTNTMAVIVQSRSPLFKAASGQKGCGWTMQQYIAHVSRVKVYAVVISTQFKKKRGSLLFILSTALEVISTHCFY